MKQFNPIKTLTKRTFHQNKGRNAVAVTAIILTTLMFTTLFVLAQSMSQNMIQMAFRQSGYDAHVSFKAITSEQLSLIAAHPDVESTGESIVLGVAENSELTGEQVEIRWADDHYAKHDFSAPTTGTMPQAYDEIALDTKTLDRLRIPHELGQTVTLEWRKDLNSKEKTESTFRLCGFWEGNQSSYASMAWISKDFANEMIGAADKNQDNQVLGLHMAHLILYSDRNIEDTVNEILADTGLTGLEYGVNLAYSTGTNNAALQQSLPLYLGMILVFLSGYLIIYNIFQISVATEIQFYGKLKTLGTTKKQIKKLIYNQANKLCMIGIPIGILLGYLLGIVLVPVLLGMVEGEISVSANPIIFIGSAIFAWLTVTVSCLRPARLAGKVSPIEALRYNDTSVSSKKKSKRGRNGASLQAMAWSNLGRNKKRTITVICSLSLGLILLSCFYAKNAAFDMNKYLEDLTISDFEIAESTHEEYMQGYDPYGTTISDELVSQIESLSSLEDIGHMYSHDFTLDLNDETISNLKNYYDNTRLDAWASYEPEAPEALQQVFSDKQTAATVYGLDGLPLETYTAKNYILDGNYDAAAFATGEYILAIGPSDESGQMVDGAVPTTPVGSKVTIEGKEYTVMAILLPLSPISGGAKEGGPGNVFSLSFVLPSDTFRQSWPDNTLRKLFFDVTEQGFTEADDMLSQYEEEQNAALPITSRQTMAVQYEKETRSSAVMGTTISIVIALVGILNFINSMVTSIVSRRKEFAMMQSIGMTKKQLSKLLIFEGLLYALFTLAVSYFISTLAVGIGIRAMVAGGYTTFHFTLLPLLLCTPILLLFAVLIPYICFRNLEKQSIVERLRTE